jgi:hypothetical protein
VRGPQPRIEALQSPEIGSKLGNNSPKSPQQRGRDNEKKVLDELGLDKNKNKVTGKEGNSVPDALTDRQSFEIKDTQRVTDSRQLRIQSEAARNSGRENVLVTGENTRASPAAERLFDRVIRFPWLGPKGK